MLGILVRTLIIALGLWLADYLLSGVAIRGTSTLIWAALLLGLVNAIVRPILVFLTFPITLLTLGFFLLVINAGMFGLVASFLKGFSVDGFFSALLGAVIVSLVSTVASWTIGPNGRYQLLIVDRRN